MGSRPHGSRLTCSYSDCILIMQADRVSRTLTLRSIPEPVVRAFRGRARRNRRSMQREILSVLQGAVLDRASLTGQLAELRSEAGAGMTVEEIREAIRAGRP